MEAACRRLSVFCSHLWPIATADGISASVCSSSSIGAEGENRARVSEDGNADLEKSCVFCRIVRGESPAYKVYMNIGIGGWIAVLDIVNRFMKMNNACAYWTEILSVVGKVIAAMCSKIPFISKAIMKATGSDSFNLLVNNGVAAGQVIFHTHIHVIPRKARDYLWASESLRRLSLKLDDEASQLAESIRENLVLGQ